MRKRQLLIYLVSLLVPLLVFSISMSIINKKANGDEQSKPTKSNVYANKSDNDVDNWVGAWGASMIVPSDKGITHDGIENQTVRMVLHPQMSGKKLRIHLSNKFGKNALTLNQVHVAISKRQAETVLGTDHKVTFKGKQDVVIPKGEEVTSDPVSMNVSTDNSLVVSIYAEKKTGPITQHNLSLQTTYIASGNHVKDVIVPAYKNQAKSWFWINGVDVTAPPSVKGTIVVIGSSIANGNHSTINANKRWPDDLARRLEKEKPYQWSVLNEGISANRLLESGPGIGDSVLKRLDRDVFSQTKVKALILHIGLNDLRHHPDKVNAEQIISAMKEVIDRSHKRGIKVYGGTLTPFKGSGLYTVRGEETRQRVNEWIRSNGDVDGVIDFDKALRDPDHPKRMLPKYDDGDHFHPNDTGYQAMADAVDLGMFK